MSWRTVIRTNTYDQLVDYQTANPTKLREVYKARPGGTAVGTPFAFVGDITTDHTHAGSTLRVQNASVEAVFLTDVVDNVEAKEELDDAVQGFIDQVGALPHYLGSNTVWQTIESSDTSESVGGVEYSGVVVTIAGITGQEGGF
jgi:hypothetical protein